MDNVLSWIEEHPYMTGGIIAAVILVIYFMFFSGGSQAASSSGGTDPLTAYYQAEAQATVAGDQYQTAMVQSQTSLASQYATDQLSYAGIVATQNMNAQNNNLAYAENVNATQATNLQTISNLINSQNNNARQYGGLDFWSDYLPLPGPGGSVLYEGGNYGDPNQLSPNGTTNPIYVPQGITQLPSTLTLPQVPQFNPVGVPG